MNQQVIERRLAYAIFTAWFLALAVIIAKTAPQLQPWEWFLFALATYRWGRLIAFNRVFETWRSPFTKEEPDESGAGLTICAREENGCARAIGELLSCPICAGTWAAMVMLCLWVAWRDLAWVLILVQGAAAVGELLHYVSEYWSWGGVNYRTQVGTEYARRIRRDY